MPPRTRPLFLALGTLVFSAVGCATQPRATPKLDSVVGGADHIGLTVSDLRATERFFVELVGFSVMRRDPKYPASFLTNGHIIVTLWRATDPKTATPFNRKKNIGLHHLAFSVASHEKLDALHEKLAAAKSVTIEFAPEPLSGGPARHMMIREPSGNRIEFIHRPPPENKRSRK